MRRRRGELVCSTLTDSKGHQQDVCTAVQPVQMHGAGAVPAWIQGTNASLHPEAHSYILHSAQGGQPPTSSS